jgi:hypothetical protein
MKTIVFSLAFALFTVSTHAQTQPAPAPTRAEVERQIAALEQQLQAEQKNVDAWSAKIKTADADFEKRIARLVDSVKRLTDSKDSGTQVIMLKQDLIGTLRKSLDFYNQQRGQRIAALEQQNPQLPKEDLKKDIAGLDARIENRINQIMQIAESFPIPKDVAKMTYHPGDYYDGWGGYEATNPEWQRQQRLGTYSEMTRTDLINALKQSVENLKRQNITLERMAQQARGQDEREFFSERISQNRSRIDVRRQQINDLLTEQNPGDRPISTAQYQTAAEQVHDVIQDLKQDFRALLQLSSNRDVARQRVRNLEVNIAYRQRQLAQTKP